MAVTSTRDGTQADRGQVLTLADERVTDIRGDDDAAALAAAGLGDWLPEDPTATGVRLRGRGLDGRGSAAR